ncbi:VOC family protein [Protaetiibacter mangrovi]|uniref:VOC family protein n=1 Tax=Protaetiibacter mangrovi TaxID=2970926 RepID=A0ABT1ZDV5_9MICO|nr:VOC family protein [Protaetiibacter mangrovi]MCS0498891.1 VOC family protein [Protaetiibacter mangrovi]TPX04391.1 VOC family protein [Schumannella luteola]
MTLPAVDHIGILVLDLEEAVERHRRVLGLEFSVAGRYRTDRYVDESDACPHRHDARFVVSRGATPRIELLEATGDGTHAPRHAGVHHLAFTGIADLDAEYDRVTAAGVRVEAQNTDDDGRRLLFFAAAEPWSGTRLELVSALPGPIVLDDGTPAPRDPRTGRPSVLMAEGESR